MFVKKFRLLILFTLLSISYSSFSQMAHFEALYMYNICRFVEWPSTANTVNFTIGVIGSNKTVVSELKLVLKGKTIHGKDVKIIIIEKTSQASDCHLIFFSRGQEGNIIKYENQRHRTLFISEGRDAIPQGSDINFIIDNNKLKFEISKDNLNSKQLQISGQLYQLASAVI